MHSLNYGLTGSMQNYPKEAIRIQGPFLKIFLGAAFSSPKTDCIGNQHSVRQKNFSGQKFYLIIMCKL